MSVEDLVSGVVNGGYQGEREGSIFQPKVSASVNLQYKAGLWFGCAARAMFRGTMLVFRGYACGAEDLVPCHGGGFAAGGEAPSFFKFFGEVKVVEVLVFSITQGNDIHLHSFGDFFRGGFAAVFASQGGVSPALARSPELARAKI